MSTATQSPSVSSPVALASQLVGGSIATSLVYVLTELELPDLLEGRPRSVSELAALTDTLADPLERVLRGLTLLGALARLDDGRYALTPVGACFGSAGPLRPLARLVGLSPLQLAWSELVHTVRTGEPAFDHAVGVDFMSFLQQDADAAERFFTMMSAATDQVAPAVVAAYDFGDVRTVVDVGGGAGALVGPILRANPHLQGLLVDAEVVREQAERSLAAAGLSNRCDFIAGDFFESVPSGADVYLLKSVLHDWDDARDEAILSVCRRAMAPESRLLVVEMLLGDGPAAAPDAVMTDLIMLAMGSGRERSLDQYRALSDRAGLRLERVIPTASRSSILEVYRGR